jgi:peptidoglycan/LPS O-acetylase OafA/YrhL
MSQYLWNTDYMANFHAQISTKADGRYIPGLDGIRAVSVFIVILSHIGFGKIAPGGFAVTLFFFISGFLITRILVAEQNKAQGNIDISNFYKRRMLRLMPALYVFIIFTYIFSLFFGVIGTKEDLFSALSYFVNYSDVVGNQFGWHHRIIPWGQLWSLGVEEHFYLLFPLCLIVFGRKHEDRLKLVIAVIIVVSLWRFFAYTQLKLSSEYTYSATDCRIENIAWGCLLAIMLDGYETSPQRLRFFIGWHWVAIGLTAIIISVVYKDELFRATWRYSRQGIAIFVLILNLYMFKPLSFAINILEFPPLKFIGRLSYSLYLWHYPIAWGAYRYIGKDISDGFLPLNLFIIVMITSFALALMSYFFIERPFIGMRKKLGGNPVESMQVAYNNGL